MSEFILWYLTVTLIGVISFPLTYRLLPALPDRGYSLNRALSLLTWGYFFWLLTSLGVTRNNPGGLLLALGVLLGLSYWAVRGISIHELLAWWRERRNLIIGVEILFLVAFAGWSVVRAANPEIQFTEKPMELAFINAITSSERFPPHDPWLSGYAISYYYFGYVLVAMLAKITAIPAGIAFNLGIALIFALSAIGLYGLVYNLLEIWGNRGGGERQRRALLGSGGGGDMNGSSNSYNSSSNWMAAFLGPLFVLVASNLDGVLEVLHARGLFWREDPSGQLTSAFWNWLDMRELSQPPAEPFSWMPSRFLWWWRASRVVQDYDLAGNWREVIDEFPFFSFLLADLHPHVLAIPFALLAIALALNLFSGGAKGHMRVLKYHLNINPHSFALGAVILGGLAFLNTWDFPIYVSLFSGAYVLHRKREWRLVELTGQNTPIGSWSLAGDFLVMALSLGVTGVLLYLPFYLGFSSQAGGVIPNLIYVTRGTHLWVMFGIFFVPLFGFLFYIWRKEGDWNRLGKGLMLAITLVSGLLFLALLMSIAIITIPTLKDLFLGSLGAVGREAELFRQAIVRRLTSPGGWITLIALLALVLGLIWPKEGKSADSIPDPHKFALLLMLTGALLVVGPEFFYLRDQFGYRINTIFKFYYQAWILFGVAAAYGTVVLIRQLRGIWGRLFEASIVVLLASALIYPCLSLWTKTDGFNPAYGWTLDGTAYLARQSQDEVEALRWLEAAPSGVVVEAVGGSYSEYARVATHSGKPTVLGWPGHESQWRGGAEEMGSRQGDIERLYRSNDWTETQEILRQYNVRYIYVGPLERSTYGVNENKFERFLQPVFQQGQVTIYEVPRVASSS